MNNEIDQLIDLFTRFSSIGRKTATRIVLDLISKKQNLIPDFINNLTNLKEKIKICEVCGNVDTHNPCNICSSEQRNKKIICIVENIEDLWAIEKTNNFNGSYHILGGVLSAVKAITTEDLNLKSLEKRIQQEEIEEIIIAINASLDGQTTAFYLQDMFKDKVEKITKLAYGMPIGSEIGYLDEGTINAAFSARGII